MKTLLLLLSVFLFSCTDNSSKKEYSTDVNKKMKYLKDSVIPGIKKEKFVSSITMSTSNCSLNPDSQIFVVNSSVYYPVPNIMPPGKCKAISDPNFNTVITRVTDKVIDAYPDAGIENEYAKADPENVNGTLLVLRTTGSNWELYNTQTFKREKELNIYLGNQEPEPRWDNVNPKLLYHVANMKLMVINVDTNTSTVVHNFKTDFPTGFLISNADEGDASLDRRYWCFMVMNSNWTPKTVFTYDKLTNTILGKKSVSRGIDWVSMDMSGNHCVIEWDGPPAQAFSRDFTKVVTLPVGTNGHADLARTQDGRDVLIYQNNSTDWIAMADLNTGIETNLVRIPFDINIDIGMHFSGNNAAVPGWALVSIANSKNLTPGSSHSWMDNNLFMVELKANPRVVRIAHTHSYISIRPNDTHHYFAEAYAAINTAGNRIYWGSNWNRTNLERIDTYVALLPNNWVNLLP